MVKLTKVKKNISKKTQEAKAQAVKSSTANKAKPSIKATKAPHKASVAHVAKVTDIKASTKKTEKSNNKKDYTSIFVGIGIIAVIALIALVAFFAMNMSPSTEPNNESADVKVLATVNGEIITTEDIDFIYSRIPAENQASYTKESLLEQLVTEKLLLQQANEKGILASEQEISEFIDLIIQTNKITKEMLEARLQEQGLNLEELEKEVSKQIILTKLVTQAVEVENKTDAELKAYYDENSQFFVEQQEGVNASHILICYQGSANGCSENRTQEEALARANDIISKITSENFADIAREYSDGPSAPNGGNLGFFGKGQMVPEFENAAFSLGVGAVSEPVLTQFGYHIIKVFDKQEAKIAAYEDVKDQIQLQLQTQDRQAAFQKYVDEVKAQSEITYN